MKYTTKSGKELPPEVVEVIEQERTLQPFIEREEYNFGFMWSRSKQGSDFWIKIHDHDDLTEFYKLYPKKDLDSYGNEIDKGEMCEFRDKESEEWKEREYIAFGEKRKGLDYKYIAYARDYKSADFHKFCRKINSNASKKSELESQMNDLLTKANELKQKIKELFKIIVKREIKEEVEIDIEFPAFFKKGDNIIKAFSQYNNVWIRKKTDIDHNYLGIDYIIEQNYEPSTPEEFNAALESAINYINEINK